MKYDAFISYAHRVDSIRATALQRALQRLAKPFLAWKALNVFRDETSLSANPALWPSIERALEQSRFFIFMACPDSADASPWCRKEIHWWLANRSPETFLIVVTGGELVFDEHSRDFNWTRTSALPREVIQGKFHTEPFYRDLRWAQDNDALSLSNARFRAEVLPLAATLHDKEPQELDSEDLHQFRRGRRFRRWAVTGLVLLTLTSLGFAWHANRKSDEADRQRRAAEKAQYAGEIERINALEAQKLAEIQRDVAEKNEREATRQRNLAEERYQIALGRQLAIQAEWARAVRADQLPLSVLLAVEGMRRLPSIETDQALRAGLALLPRHRWSLPQPDPNTVDFRIGSAGIRFTPDGKWVVTAEGIWDAASGKSIATLNHEGRSTAMALSADGTLVARGGGAGIVRVWKVPGGAPVTGSLRSGVPITALAFSPDGRLLAAGGADNLVRVWNAASGAFVKSLEHLSRDLSGATTAIAFSPDGQRLAAARRNEVRLWNVATWEPTSLAIRSASGAVLGLAFSLDGQFIATTTPGAVQVWDLTGAPRERFSFAAGFGRPRAVAFSPDRKAKYLGVTGDISQVWEIEARRLVARADHGGAIAFSPDAARVATGGADNTARIIDLGTGREIARMAHESRVLSAAFSPDGRSLASASAAGLLHLWETAAAADVVRIEGVHARFVGGGRFSASITEDHVIWLWDRGSGRTSRVPADGSARAVTLSADGTRFVTVSADAVSVWDLPTGRQIARLDHGQPVDWEAVQLREEKDRKRSYRVVRPEIARMKDEGSVTILALSADARYVVTARADEIARLWDVSRGQPIQQIPYREAITSAFSPNGALLATAARGEPVHVWESATGRAITQLKVTGDFRTLAFSHDGRYLVGTGNNGVLLWELSGERALATIAGARDASFDPTGRFLVVREVNKATPWDLRAGRALPSVECTCQIRAIVFSPDGKHFAGAGDDGTVRIRSLAAGGVSRDLTQVNANSIVFSPDAALLVISEDEVDLTSGGTPMPTGAGWLRVWDIRSGRELVSIKQSNAIGSLIVSPDSKYIAGYDRVWESRTGREVTRVKGEIVAFSPDMSFLLTTENKRTGVWVWRPHDLIAAACRQLPRNLTRAEWRSYLGNEPYRNTCAGVSQISPAVPKDIVLPNG